MSKSQRKAKSLGALSALQFGSKMLLSEAADDTPSSAQQLKYTPVDTTLDYDAKTNSFVKVDRPDGFVAKDGAFAFKPSVNLSQLVRRYALATNNSGFAQASAALEHSIADLLKAKGLTKELPNGVTDNEGKLTGVAGKLRGSVSTEQKVANYILGSANASEKELEAMVMADLHKDTEMLPAYIRKYLNKGTVVVDTADLPDAVRKANGAMVVDVRLCCTVDGSVSDVLGALVDVAGKNPDHLITNGVIQLPEEDNQREVIRKLIADKLTEKMVHNTGVLVRIAGAIVVLTSENASQLKEAVEKVEMSRTAGGGLIVEAKSVDGETAGVADVRRKGFYICENVSYDDGSIDLMPALKDTPVSNGTKFESFLDIDKLNMAMYPLSVGRPFQVGPIFEAEYETNGYKRGLDALDLIIRPPLLQAALHNLIEQAKFEAKDGENVVDEGSTSDRIVLRNVKSPDIVNAVLRSMAPVFATLGAYLKNMGRSNGVKVVDEYSFGNIRSAEYMAKIYASGNTTNIMGDTYAYRQALNRFRDGITIDTITVTPDPLSKNGWVAEVVVKVPVFRVEDPHLHVDAGGVVQAKGSASFLGGDTQDTVMTENQAHSTIAKRLTQDLMIDIRYKPFLVDETGKVQTSGVLVDNIAFSAAPRNAVATVKIGGMDKLTVIKLPGRRLTTGADLEKLLASNVYAAVQAKKAFIVPQDKDSATDSSSFYNFSSAMRGIKQAADVETFIKDRSKSIKSVQDTGTKAEVSSHEVMIGKSKPSYGGAAFNSDGNYTKLVASCAAFHEALKYLMIIIAGVKDAGIVVRSDSTVEAVLSDAIGSKRTKERLGDLGATILSIVKKDPRTFDGITEFLHNNKEMSATKALTAIEYTLLSKLHDCVAALRASGVYPTDNLFKAFGLAAPKPSSTDGIKNPTAEILDQVYASVVVKLGSLLVGINQQFAGSEFKLDANGVGMFANTIAALTTVSAYDIYANAEPEKFVIALDEKLADGQSKLHNAYANLVSNKNTNVAAFTQKLASEHRDFKPSSLDDTSEESAKEAETLIDVNRLVPDAHTQTAVENIVKATNRLFASVIPALPVSVRKVLEEKDLDALKEEVLEEMIDRKVVASLDDITVSSTISNGDVLSGSSYTLTFQTKDGSLFNAKSKVRPVSEEVNELIAELVKQVDTRGGKSSFARSLTNAVSKAGSPKSLATEWNVSLLKNISIIVLQLEDHKDSTEDIRTTCKCIASVLEQLYAISQMKFSMGTDINFLKEEVMGIRSVLSQQVARLRNIGVAGTEVGTANCLVLSGSASIGKGFQTSAKLLYVGDDGKTKLILELKSPSVQSIFGGIGAVTHAKASGMASSSSELLWAFSPADEVAEVRKTLTPSVKQEAVLSAISDIAGRQWDKEEGTGYAQLGSKLGNVGQLLNALRSHELEVDVENDKVKSCFLKKKDVKLQITAASIPRALTMLDPSFHHTPSNIQTLSTAISVAIMKVHRYLKADEKEKAKRLKELVPCKITLKGVGDGKVEFGNVPIGIESTSRPPLYKFPQSDGSSKSFSYNAIIVSTPTLVDDNSVGADGKPVYAPGTKQRVSDVHRILLTKTTISRKGAKTNHIASSEFVNKESLVGLVASMCKKSGVAQTDDIKSVFVSDINELRNYATADSKWRMVTADFIGNTVGLQTAEANQKNLPIVRSFVLINITDMTTGQVLHSGVSWVGNIPDSGDIVAADGKLTNFDKLILSKLVTVYSTPGSEPSTTRSVVGIMRGTDVSDDSTTTATAVRSIYSTTLSSILGNESVASAIYGGNTQVLNSTLLFGKDYTDRKGAVLAYTGPDAVFAADTPVEATLLTNRTKMETTEGGGVAGADDAITTPEDHAKLFKDAVERAEGETLAPTGSKA